MRGLGGPGKYLAKLRAAWLARYGEVFAHETGGKDRWPVWDEALIAVLLRLSQDERRPCPTLWGNDRLEQALAHKRRA